MPCPHCGGHESFGHESFMAVALKYDFMCLVKTVTLTLALFAMIRLLIINEMAVEVIRYIIWRPFSFVGIPYKPIFVNGAVIALSFFSVWYLSVLR
jgi:hypothetical protein